MKTSLAENHDSMRIMQQIFRAQTPTGAQEPRCHQDFWWQNDKHKQLTLTLTKNLRFPTYCWFRNKVFIKWNTCMRRFLRDADLTWKWKNTIELHPTEMITRTSSFESFPHPTTMSLNDDLTTQSAFVSFKTRHHNTLVIKTKVQLQSALSEEKARIPPQIALWTTEDDTFAWFSPLWQVLN